MGFVVKRPSRMQEQSFFVFGRDGHLFSGGSGKNSGGGRNFAAGLPPPGSDTPHTLVGGVISSAGTNYLSIYYLIVCPLLNATTSTNWKYGIAHNFGTCAGVRVEVVTMISHCDF